VLCWSAQTSSKESFWVHGIRFCHGNLSPSISYLNLSLIWIDSCTAGHCYISKWGICDDVRKTPVASSSLQTVFKKRSKTLTPRTIGDTDPNILSLTAGHTVKLPWPQGPTPLNTPEPQQPSSVLFKPNDAGEACTSRRIWSARAKEEGGPGQALGGGPRGAGPGRSWTRKRGP